MALNYQKALTILKKWPVNPVKGNCDFGLYLRQRIQQALPDGEIFPGGPVRNEKILDSLLRLVENKCGKQYEPLKMGGSGIEKEFLQKMLEPHNFNKIAGIKKAEQ